MRSVVLFRGYLHQHQPEYESIGLLQAEWEMRWLTLGSGGLLKIFEGDRDEGQEPGAMIYIAVSRAWARQRAAERRCAARCGARRLS